MQHAVGCGQWCDGFGHARKELAIGGTGSARRQCLFLLCLCPRLISLACGLGGRMQAFEVGESCLIAPHSPATVARLGRPCSLFLRW
jgi:hypothetical protein